MKSEEVTMSNLNHAVTESVRGCSEHIRNACIDSAVVTGVGGQTLRHGVRMAGEIEFLGRLHHAHTRQHRRDVADAVKVDRSVEVGTNRWRHYVGLDADPRSVYFHQMQNGMFVRMALLAAVLGASA